MGEFPQEAELQSNGLYVICNLAFENEQNQSRIGTFHGISLILNAMNHFPMDMSVQSYGLPALGNLSSTNAKNRAVIGDLSGTELVLAKSPKLKSEMRSKSIIPLVNKAKDVLGADDKAVQRAIHALKQ